MTVLWKDLDEKDTAECLGRQMLLARDPNPRVGDFVEFDDGVVRRISYVLSGGGVQTSDSGSWYLGYGYVSFSGGLFHSVPMDTLTRIGERDGRVWFFHHDEARAHNGIETTIPFRVYRCSLPAPR